MCRFKRTLTLVAAMLAVLGLQQLGSAGYIRAKASLAQYLIAHAWQQTLANGGEPRRPWPWADTWPVARLQAPARGIDLYVLAGAAGNALAFGPGFEVASVPPGQAGTSVIAGHRDTHFGFLRHLPAGELLLVQLPGGESLIYKVSAAEVVDSRRSLLQIRRGGANELLLVTCYPFDDLQPGGPLRYVVRAQPREEYLL